MTVFVWGEDSYELAKFTREMAAGAPETPVIRLAAKVFDVHERNHRITAMHAPDQPESW